MKNLLQPYSHSLNSTVNITVIYSHGYFHISIFHMCKTVTGNKLRTCHGSASYSLAADAEVQVQSQALCVECLLGKKSSVQVCLPITLVYWHRHSTNGLRSFIHSFIHSFTHSKSHYIILTTDTFVKYHLKSD